jgi:hypothetical protein
MLILAGCDFRRKRGALVGKVWKSGWEQRKEVSSVLEAHRDEA